MAESPRVKEWKGLRVQKSKSHKVARSRLGLFRSGSRVPETGNQVVHSRACPATTRRNRLVVPLRHVLLVSSNQNLSAQFTTGTLGNKKRTRELDVRLPFEFSGNIGENGDRRPAHPVHQRVVLCNKA